MINLYWIQVIALSALSVMVGMLISSLYTRGDHQKGRDEGWAACVDFLEKSGQVKVKDIGEKPKH